MILIEMNGIVENTTQVSKTDNDVSQLELLSKKFSLIEGMKDAIDAIMEHFIYYLHIKK